MFRKTAMLGGSLLHAGFSLRALEHCGYDMPRFVHGELIDPGERDGRLRRGLFELESGDWPSARSTLLDVLETHPGCLVSHSRLGGINAALLHVGLAVAHYTAAIRLGMGALSSEARVPLDPSRTSDRALLQALKGRAGLLLDSGQPELAGPDLRRAVEWDPTDSVDVGSLVVLPRAMARRESGAVRRATTRA